MTTAWKQAREAHFRAERDRRAALARQAAQSRAQFTARPQAPVKDVSPSALRPDGAGSPMSENNNG